MYFKIRRVTKPRHLEISPFGQYSNFQLQKKNNHVYINNELCVIIGIQQFIDSINFIKPEPVSIMTIELKF